MVRLSERAAAADPKNGAFVVTHGIALLRAGQFKKAAARIADGLELHDGTGGPWDDLFLAMAHHRLGDGKEARRALTSAVQKLDAEVADRKKDVDAAPPSGFALLARTGSGFVRAEVEGLLKEKK